MKNFLRFLVSVAAMCFLIGISAPYLQEFGVTPTENACFIVALVVAVAVVRRGSAADPDMQCSDVDVQYWVNYIMDRLWADNAFLVRAYSDDLYVNGLTVHIPQPGSLPGVTLNRSVFPATATKRTDTTADYNIDEFSTDPTHIPNAQMVQYSYDMIESVLGDHVGVLTKKIAEKMIVNWLASAPFANIVTTSGAAAAAQVAGQTGNRNAMVHVDLKKARKIMNLSDVPGSDRQALLEENMCDQMVDSLSTSQYKDFSQYYDARTGVIGQLYGFDIMTRSSVAIAAALSGTNPLGVNAIGAATGATDNVVSFCWQKSAVARAIGQTDFFENKKDALYQGDVYSALARAGGRRRRANAAGLIAIVQA